MLQIYGEIGELATRACQQNGHVIVIDPNKKSIEKMLACTSLERVGKTSLEKLLIKF